MIRHKYELSAYITSPSCELGSDIKLWVSGFGNTRHELIKNTFVYVLDSDNSELDLMHMNETSDFVFGQCINLIRAVVSAEELKQVAEGDLHEG
jgi:hypothetical protein